MRRSLLPLLLAATLVPWSSSSCFITVEKGGGGPRVQGSGVRATEVRAVGGFHALEVAGAYRLEVEVGPPPEVTVTCDDNLLGCVVTAVRGGVLSVRTQCRCSTHEGITVRVRTPTLDRLELSGSQQARVLGLQGGSFELEASGSVTATLSGRVERLTLSSHGSSELDLSGLAARRAKLELDGDSTVTVDVEEELAIEASGSSSIRYRGRPSVTVDQSGSTQVTRLD